MNHSNTHGTGVNIGLITTGENKSPMKSFYDELSEAIKPYHQASKSQAMTMFIDVNHSKEFNKLIKAIENDK